MAKTTDETFTLLEDMASNNYQSPSERSIVKKATKVFEVDQLIALTALISAFSNQFSAFTTYGALPKETVTVANISYPIVEMELEQAQYLNNRNFGYRGNQLPNNYHLSVWNHENFSYGNNQNVLQPPPGYANQQVEKKPLVEDLLGTFIAKTRNCFKQDDARFNNIEMHIGNMDATIKSLEVQIGQIASSINAYQRGKFPSDTEVNPKEQCKAITLRSGKDIEGARKEKPVKVNPTSIPHKESTDNEKEEQVEKSPKIKGHGSIVVPEISMPKPALPYPQRFQKKKMDAQFT